MRDPWDELVAESDAFTCYSAALGTWLSLEDPDWAARIDSGLHLAITDERDGLFGFSHFPGRVAADLGLVLRGTDDQDEALTAVERELELHGRVVVAGDGFRLPWHVAFGRRHVPHWFTVCGDEILDPFAARSELGVQRQERRRVSRGELAGLLGAVPRHDPVLELREAFGLGIDARPLPDGAIAWLSRADGPVPTGAFDAEGPHALRTLATHFRARGTEPAAYRQVDDIWSIARHRAFMARRAAADGSRFAEQHAVPLATLWGHVAPLLLQARLAVEAGRSPSGSVSAKLDELADREAAAAGG